MLNIATQSELSRKPFPVLFLLLRFTTTFDLKYSSHVQGCSFTAYEKYQYQIWNGVLNTGTVHTFQHDDGSQDMPENDNFAIVGLANTISSWRCECA